MVSVRIRIMSCALLLCGCADRCGSRAVPAAKSDRRDVGRRTPRGQVDASTRGLWRRPSSYRGRPRFRTTGPTQIAALRADGHEQLADAFDGRRARESLDARARRLAADVTWALVRSPPDPYFRGLDEVYLITDGSVPKERRPQLVQVRSLRPIEARAAREGVRLYYESVHVAGAQVRSRQPAVVVEHRWGVIRPRPAAGSKPPCFGLARYLAVRGIEGGIVLFDDGLGTAAACP
jgi:hypothetical protein